MRIASATVDQYLYFVAVDATDLKTRETGLATWTVYRSRNGAAAAAFTTPTINETDVTNMPGVYELLLDEDMTIAAGNSTEAMVVHITHAGMAPVTLEFELFRPTVTEGNTLAVDASGNGASDIIEVAGAAVSTSTAQLGVNVVNAAGTAWGSGAVTAASLAADAGTEIAAAVWDRDATLSQTQGTFGQTLGDSAADTGTIFKATVTDATGVTVGTDTATLLTRMGTPSDLGGGATLSGNLSDIEGQTDDIGAAGAGLTVLATQASVNTIDDFLDTEIAAIKAITDKLDELVLNRTTIATLATQTSFTITAGSADNDAYNGCVIVIQDASTAVQKAVGVILDYTGATKTVTLLTDPAVFTMAATDIVNIIADRALKATVDNRNLDVSAGGEAGMDWANIGSPTTAQNLSGTNIDVDQVVASVSGAVGSVTGAVGSVTGLTAATVHSDLDDIQARLPAALVGGRMDSSVGAMAANVLTAAATAADYLAEINAEVADVLKTDTVTLPGQGAPPAAPTMQEILSWLYKTFRNRKTQTATQWNLYNDAEDTIDSKATVSSDGTTSIKQEIVTGP